MRRRRRVRSRSAGPRGTRRPCRSARSRRPCAPTYGHRRRPARRAPTAAARCAGAARRSRGRAPSRARRHAMQIALLVLVQRARCGMREALARDDCGTEADKAVEVIGRGEREVHRARRPATLDLQMTLEVETSEVPRARLAQRGVGLRLLGEPADIGRHVGSVRLAGARRQRLAGEIVEVAPERARAGSPCGPRLLVEAASGSWAGSMRALVDPRPDGSFV